MTTKPPPETYLDVWKMAEAAEIGIEIRCDPEDQRSLVNALYECRQHCGGFEELMLFQPKPPGTIFIRRKALESPE